MNSCEVLETPDKPEYSKNSYRIIRLENGLKALLVCDPVLTLVNAEKPAIATSATIDKKQEGTEEKPVADVNDIEPNQERVKFARCGLCVDVGTFSSPRDVQGLPHFLGKCAQV